MSYHCLPFMHCPLVANQKTRWSIVKTLTFILIVFALLFLCTYLEGFEPGLSVYGGIALTTAPQRQFITLLQ